MATTYENMVLNETFRREKMSQRDWGKQHGTEHHKEQFLASK